MIQEYLNHFRWSGVGRAAIILMVMMLPNIFYFILPKNNMPESVGAGPVVEMIENMARIAFFVVLFAFTTDKKPKSSIFLIVMIVCMIVYYLLWVRYFANGFDYPLLSKSLWFIPVPMAVFPVLFMIASGLWLGSVPLVVTAVVFGVAHIVESLGM